MGLRRAGSFLRLEAGELAQMPTRRWPWQTWPGATCLTSRLETANSLPVWLGRWDPFREMELAEITAET